MHWLNLPEPEASRPLAFSDEAAARAWLATQPRAQPQAMLAVLGEQVAALDAAHLTPALALSLLNLLRSAALPILASLEVRYSRKALPLPDEDLRTFEHVQQLWTRMGVAYLRLAPHFAPGEKCLPLQRAANAFREAQFAHFHAGRESSSLLDQLLFEVLIQAESSGILRQPLTDPEFPHLGEANIAGLVAWAFLLRLIDPYRLTAGQLAVANRAISRWRELCSFHAEVDPSPKAQVVSLATLFDAPLPEGALQWLDIRSVVRKIHSRIASLQAGESPESLKLGRELSGTACVRLLVDIEQCLHPRGSPPSDDKGEIELIFGPDDAYAVFAEQRLNPSAGMDVNSRAVSNQRMALFGFDQISRMPTAVRKLQVPGETWQMLDGKVVRPALGGPRRLAPCLVATYSPDGAPRLGVMRRLLADASGTLYASLDWFTASVEAASLPAAGRESGALRIPAFVLRAEGAISLIVPPTAPLRLDVGLALEGASFSHLVPFETLERGMDFVRYACRSA